MMPNTDLLHSPRLFFGGFLELLCDLGFYSDYPALPFDAWLLFPPLAGEGTALLEKIARLWSYIFLSYRHCSYLHHQL